MKIKLTILTTISLVLIGWGTYVNLFDPLNEVQRNYITDLYGVIALVSAVFGFGISKQWGGKKSLVGKSIFFFSLGLLMQFFGNLGYSVIYLLTSIENPYPSFPEIFYVLSVPFYIIGITNLAYSSGAKINLKTSYGKNIAMLIPLFLITAAYLFFLHNKISQEEPLLNIILEIYYPISQTIFVSGAIVAVVLSSNVLGGIMRSRVLFILFSLIFQYGADAVFLYKTKAETWQPAGISDLMFMISYFLLGIGIISYQKAAEQLTNSRSK